MHPIRLHQARIGSDSPQKLLWTSVDFPRFKEIKLTVFGEKKTNFGLKWTTLDRFTLIFAPEREKSV
jgi:hypothetical protein